MPIANQIAVRSFAWESPPDVDSDPDTRTSMQWLGSARVSVEFVSPRGEVSVTGAWINAEFAEASEFSAQRVALWERAIQREIDSEADDAAECAREAAE